ncbi:MAG: endonuclease MutS2 [Melioribacteraceae bacterium]|nr:endonuclease MutS2 [Melioribacteraceae bacterium]
MIELNSLEQLEYFKVIEIISKSCYTEIGKEIAFSLLPKENIPEIILSGSRISAAKEILIKNEFPPLNYIPNISDNLVKSRIQNTFLREEEILQVIALAEISRNVYSFIKSKDNEGLFSEIINSLFIDKAFENILKNNFDDKGKIKDSASAKLKEIRRNIYEKEANLNKVINKLLKEFSDSYLVREEYVTVRDGRMVVPVKSEHKRQIKGFIHSESASGQTVYIEPASTLELNNDILSLKFEEKREIEKILKIITSKIGEYSESLLMSLKKIGQIDFIFANAKYSIEINGSFPTFEENKPLIIYDGRHPLLIKRIGYSKTVPLEFKIEKENVLVITGPNAGGKTVVLKTVGILIALIQSGIHVPIHPDSNLHLFGNILLDIGDNQSIEDDLSTFSSHLSNIKQILEKADDNSLVLLDEVGTGTDPFEGSAIATAVLVTLQKAGSTILSTTHSSNLKILANQLEGFQNASMEFDKLKLSPTFKFIQGVPGSSYAFEVAQRIGFKTEFIELAKSFLDSSKIKVEDFITQLEEKSNILKDQLAKSKIENTRLKGLANLYQSKVEKLEGQKKEILNNTKIKADLLLNDINRKIESAIKNIKESNASKEVIKKEKNEIEFLKKEALKYNQTNSVLDIEIVINSYVRLKNTGTTGQVIDIINNKKRAVVNTGKLNITTNIEDLEVIKRTESESPVEKIRTNYSPDIGGLKLDIRGRKPEEAEFDIIKFLDDSYAAEISRVEILHGKGGGVLKATVHEILKKSFYIKKYYFAQVEFGGEGITIVEFK